MCPKRKIQPLSVQSMPASVTSTANNFFPMFKANSVLFCAISLPFLSLSINGKTLLCNLLSGGSDKNPPEPPLLLREPLHLQALILGDKKFHLPMFAGKAIYQAANNPGSPSSMVIKQRRQEASTAEQEPDHQIEAKAEDKPWRHKRVA